MSDDDARKALANAVQSLAVSPFEWAGYLAAASQLAASGRADDAAHVFARLGEVACAHGRVPLAIGCARWLGQHGVDATALIDRIATTHGAGSKAIVPGTRQAPPTVRGKFAPAQIKATLDEAVADARAAVDAAADAVLARAPEELPPTPLASALAPDDLRALIGVVQLRALPRGTVVVDVGDPATALYWIATGAVTITRDQQRLGELRGGAFFGEIALVGGTTRTARVTTSDDTWLLEIPADEIERLAVKAPAVAKVLAQQAHARLLANVMRTSPVFTLLPEAERDTLLDQFEPAFAKAGRKILTRGEPNEHLWILVSGTCEVRDGATVLATLTAGAGVGEMSLLDGGAAGADVVALTHTALLTLSRERFREVADRFPDVLAELRRLRDERAAANASIAPGADDTIV